MSDRRSWRLDAAAGVLLLVGLLLARRRCSATTRPTSTKASIRSTPRRTTSSACPAPGSPAPWSADSAPPPTFFLADVVRAGAAAVPAPRLADVGAAAGRLAAADAVRRRPRRPLRRRLAGQSAGRAGRRGRRLAVNLWLAAHFDPVRADRPARPLACVLGLALSADFLVRRLPRFAWWGLRSLWDAVPGLPSFARPARGRSRPPDASAVTRRPSKDQEAPTPPDAETEPAAGPDAGSRRDARRICGPFRSCITTPSPRRPTPHGKTAVVARPTTSASPTTNCRR